MALFSFRSPSEEPNLEKVCEKFGFAPEEVDTVFGVIEVDDVEKVYTIRVEETAAARVTGEQDTSAEGWQLEGPHSDARIAPFGPPEP